MTDASEWNGSGQTHRQLASSTITVGHGTHVPFASQYRVCGGQSGAAAAAALFAASVAMPVPVSPRVFTALSAASSVTGTGVPPAVRSSGEVWAEPLMPLVVIAFRAASAPA